MSDFREWVLAQRAAALREMDRARVRIEVLDEILVKLPRETAPAKAAAPRKAPPLNGGSSPKPLSPSHRETLKTLEDAGKEGLTAQELATLETLKIGTASSRLSVLRTNGYADLNTYNHKYFVMHSEREDNNINGESA